MSDFIDQTEARRQVWLWLSAQLIEAKFTVVNGLVQKVAQGNEPTRRRMLKAIDQVRQSIEKTKIRRKE